MMNLAMNNPTKIADLTAFGGQIGAN